jgi:hypothetical protein
MDKPAPPRVEPASPSQPIKVYAGCLVLGLVVGLALTGIPWLQAQRERNALDQQLQRSNVELQLASAAVMARHGDYGAARDAASQFFTGVRTWVDAGGNMLTPAQRSHLESVLAERDALITLLARSDPAGAERTTVMYVDYRGAFPR